MILILSPVSIRPSFSIVRTGEDGVLLPCNLIARHQMESVPDARLRYDGIPSRLAVEQNIDMVCIRHILTPLPRRVKAKEVSRSPQEIRYPPIGLACELYTMRDPAARLWVHRSGGPPILGQAAQRRASIDPRCFWGRLPPANQICQ